MTANSRHAARPRSPTQRRGGTYGRATALVVNHDASAAVVTNASGSCLTELCQVREAIAAKLRRRWVDLHDTGVAAFPLHRDAWVVVGHIERRLPLILPRALEAGGPIVPTIHASR